MKQEKGKGYKSYAGMFPSIENAQTILMLG